jgi:hypothetical protein
MNIRNSATVEDLAIFRTNRSLFLDDRTCAYGNSGQEVARFKSDRERLQRALAVFNRHRISSLRAFGKSDANVLFRFAHRNEFQIDRQHAGGSRKGRV